jgi:hypothetical protein
VNKDNILSFDGEHALECIRNGAAIAIGAAARILRHLKCS